jgi:uncharacterized protein (DUF2147 family)
MSTPFRICLALCLLLPAAVLCAAAASAEPHSPVGWWKTFDDKTGRARGIVRIYEQDGRLFGRVEKTFKPGGDSRVCVACTDERRNRPIIGLIILRNLRAEGDAYAGGDILDPETGVVYRCKLRLDPAGARLEVRGYIGIPLMGRTQTWQRAPAPTGDRMP